jgi:hypothetical protein
MNRIVVVSLIVCIAFFAMTAASGCRIRTVEPDEYRPETPGHLNPVEARQLISNLMSRHGIKLAYNSKLDFRGLKINADGWDYNLGIGYVYLINPPAGAQVNFEIPKKPDADGMKQLEKMEKVQHTYILWVTEGTGESIAAEVEAFIEKLYRTGAIAKARPPKPREEEKKDGQPKDGEKKEDAKDTAGDEPKKKDKEKSKVMKMIEDGDDDDKKDEKKGDKKDE